MGLYVYQLRLNEKFHDLANWDESVQNVLKMHADYLHKGVTAGRVVLVGRTDTQLKDNFGITLFEADNEETAGQFMQADPVVQQGIMSAQVFPFKLLMVTDEAQKWNVW